jgi:uncharacterized protein (DUF3820 family)
MAHEGSICMPFGKHKGTELSEIPTAYLDWLIGQEWFKGDLKTSVEAHLETRADWLRDDGEEGGHLDDEYEFMAGRE